MHRVLGEFLTECGRVEFLMIIFADYISEPGIEAIFADLSGPFGPKIVAFKKWCDFSGVSKDKKPILDRVYKKLDELLPKRNFLGGAMRFFRNEDGISLAAECGRSISKASSVAHLHQTYLDILFGAPRRRQQA